MNTQTPTTDSETVHTELEKPRLTRVVILCAILFVAISLFYGWTVARQKHSLTTDGAAEISKKVVAQVGASEFVVPATDNRSRVVLKGGTGDFVFQKDRTTTYTGNIRLSDYAAQVFPYSVTAFVSDRQDDTSKVYLGLFSDTRNTIVHLDSMLLFDLADIAKTGTSTSIYTPHTEKITIKNIESTDPSLNMPGDAYDDVKSFAGRIEINWPDGTLHSYSFDVSGEHFSK